MKYVKCNVRLLNEINLLTIAVVSAANMIECMTEIKDNSSWAPFINKYIEQTKEASKLKNEDILQEEIYLEEKNLLKKDLISSIQNKQICFLLRQSFLMRATSILHLVLWRTQK